MIRSFCAHGLWVVALTFASVAYSAQAKEVSPARGPASSPPDAPIRLAVSTKTATTLGAAAWSTRFAPQGSSAQRSALAYEVGERPSIRISNAPSLLTSVTGDINGDGVVDLADYFSWRSRRWTFAETVSLPLR